MLGAGIVGGDLVSAPQWVISVTALGDLGGREPVRCGGAHARVTPSPWWASSAGRLPDIVVAQRTSTASTSCARRHLVPEPPYGQGRVAADAGATAMTDVSDGLLADLGHIADASGVGIDVSTAALSADRDALSAVAAARRRRSVGVGARGRGGPCVGRDVPRRAASGLARASAR